MKVIRVNITFVYILSILLVIVIFGILTYYNRNPLRKVWTYEGRFAVLDVNTFTLTSYPSDNTDIISIVIPTEYYVEVPNGHGFYRLNDVAELSKSESKNDTLVVMTVSNLIGIPIETTTSNLSYWDQYAIWRLKTRSEISQSVINLSEYPITTMEERSDGSSIEKIDVNKIDVYIQDTFWERQIRNENLSLGIYNASDQAGIANIISRVLEKTGFRIVEVSNWRGGSSFEKCQLYIRNESIRDTASVNRILQIEKCDIVIGGEKSERFDMRLVIK